MAKVTEIVAQLAAPAVEQAGCELWDVEYVREAGTWFLRLYLDKEGGVDIIDCENVSRATDPLIDAADPITQAYYYEVSSPGIGRDLVRPWHFDKYMGQDIEVRLIRAENGQREFMGALLSHDDTSVTIRVGEEEKNIVKKDCAFIRLYEEIDMSRQLDEN